MNRLIIAAASAACACAAAVPAVLGLSGNPSFSEHIKVPVPSQARLVHFDEQGQVVAEKSTSTSVPRPARTHESEPGDDHGGQRTSREPGDDHGGQRTSREPEPGDDHGGRTSTTTEPGDDHGGRTSTTEAGDDGGHHRHGGESGHGGSGGDD